MSDAASLRDFYERLFGWKFDTNDPNFEPTPIPPVGEFAMMRDPEGHVIGLLHSQGA